MPNLWDKPPDPPSASDLNPLTNPLLEQHLGRWARIYFSNPPAKRDQAVSNLLQEIKRESAVGTATEPPRTLAADSPSQGPVCSICQHHNPPGHKFCSRCGHALKPETPASAISSDRPAIGEAPPAGATPDVQWLRDRVFSNLDADVPRSRGWKYMIAAGVIVLSGIAYLQWAPRSKSGMVPTATTPQVNPAASLAANNSTPSEPSRPQEAASQNTISPESKKPETQAAPPKMEASDRTPVPEGMQSAVQRSPLPGTTPAGQAAAGQDNGDVDLRLAQRYLGGSMGVRDSSEAAKLLWRAVSKQNASAALLLSDLYVRGDGVPRSCDQARLLLIAAARRGASQAAQQLRNLESQGCQ